jgi:hypothetical protein
MDNISLNEIFNGFNKQKASFDYKKIDKMIRDKYDKELELYDLVSPDEITDLLSTGNAIRYTKRENFKLS